MSTNVTVLGPTSIDTSAYYAPDLLGRFDDHLVGERLPPGTGYPVADLESLAWDEPMLVDLVRLDRHGRIPVSEIAAVIAQTRGRSTFWWTIRKGDIVLMTPESMGDAGIDVDEYGYLPLPRVCQDVLGVGPGDYVAVLATAHTIVLRECHHVCSCGRVIGHAEAERQLSRRLRRASKPSVPRGRLR